MYLYTINYVKSFKTEVCSGYISGHIYCLMGCIWAERGLGKGCLGTVAPLLGLALEEPVCSGSL